MPPTANMKSEDKPQGLTMLFADDERSLQEIMKLELPLMGHRVTVCPDGLTAAAALEKDNFDCILVDLDMPGMSGIEATKAITEEFEDAAIIGLSMHDAEDIERAIKEAGAQDYICKNSPAEMILATVKKYLQRNSQ